MESDTDITILVNIGLVDDMVSLKYKNLPPPLDSVFCLTLKSSATIFSRDIEYRLSMKRTPPNPTKPVGPYTPKGFDV